MRLREFGLVLLVLGVASCATPRPSQPEGPTAVTIALGGDVMFGRWDGDARQQYRNPRVWSQARAVVDPADLTIVNLETAICSDEVARAVARSGVIQLTAPAMALDVLSDAGVDIASVANNHATDCGPNSVSRTSRALAGVGVEAVGVDGEAFRTRVRGVPVVAMAVTTVRPPVAPARDEPGPWYVPREEFGAVVEDVARRRAESPEAIVLVSLHWGVEGADQPSGWQRERARELVDAGADVVHGHGSHTVQNIEEYRGGVIVYGLGNLHFDMRRGATAERAVAVVRCGERCDVNLRWLERSD